MHSHWKTPAIPKPANLKLFRTSARDSQQGLVGPEAEYKGKGHTYYIFGGPYPEPRTNICVLASTKLFETLYDASSTYSVYCMSIYFAFSGIEMQDSLSSSCDHVGYVVEGFEFRLGFMIY